GRGWRTRWVSGWSPDGGSSDLDGPPAAAARHAQEPDGHGPVRGRGQPDHRADRATGLVITAGMATEALRLRFGADGEAETRPLGVGRASGRGREAGARGGG